MKSPLAKTLRSVVRHLQPVDHLAHYECEVLSQNLDDGTLEVKPSDPRLGRGLSRVVLDLGEGIEATKVAPGARVMVSFKNGDPDQPRATWIKGSVLELAIKAQAKITIDAPTIEIGKTATSVSLGKGLSLAAALGDQTDLAVIGKPSTLVRVTNTVVKI